VLGEQVTIGAYAVLNGGVAIGDRSYIGHHAVLGEPEYGYACARSTAVQALTRLSAVG
jgi:acetyltransferase-like isoleucine patch superfamily enzyme